MSQENRQIHNFKSELLYDKTLNEEGYSIDSLGRTSSKFIWATCRFCGEPHRIRKGFYNKIGSACHKECKIKEQKSNSPFKNKSTREKSKQTNLDKYGFEYASQNKAIATKISNSKSKESSKQKLIETCLQKYGVDNPAKSEEIKNKTRDFFLQKYNVDHPAKLDLIKDKKSKTLFERYGKENPNQVDLFAEKRLESYKNNILNNTNFTLINYLRSENFWKDLENKNLKQIAEEQNLSYQSLASTLSRKEFKDKFIEVYTFPRCQKQQEVYNQLKEICDDLIMNDRSAIYPAEIDIYSPSRKIGIEFNGSYWHSEAHLSIAEAKSKHINKTLLCEEKGIRLIHVFEKDWDLKSNQYMSFLRSAFSSNKNKIFARKCLVDNNVENKFLNAYHIQGSPASVLKWFNLRLNGNLIASMTASKHHRQTINSKNIVLSRFCCKEDYSVAGGVSKLLKHFKIWAKSQGYEKIISWSDNTISQGNVYKILGFEKEKVLSPDYFYWDAKINSYRSKQSQKKSNTGCPKDITEREWCLANGMYRIYDCGKIRWTMKI